MRNFGEVLREQVFYLKRSGFDAFTLRTEQAALVPAGGPGGVLVALRAGVALLVAHLDVHEVREVGAHRGQEPPRVLARDDVLPQLVEDLLHVATTRLERDGERAHVVAVEREAELRGGLGA